MSSDQKPNEATGAPGWFSELQQLLRRTPKEEQVRTLQQRFQEAQTECQATLERIEQADTSELHTILEEHAQKFGGPEQKEAFQETRSRIQAMQEESDALQRIRRDAGPDHALAARGYEEYLRQHPESSLGYLYLAGALEQLDDREACISACRQLVRLAGSASERLLARMQLGRALHRNGDLDAAIAELRGAVDGATRDLQRLIAPVYLALGDALHDQGDQTRARAAWQEVVRTDTIGIAREDAERKLRTLPAAAEGGGDPASPQ